MNFLVERSETGKYYIWTDTTGTTFRSAEIARGLDREQLAACLHYLNGGSDPDSVRIARKLVFLAQEPED
ncbi:hypothetical protein HMPREF2526_06150 [Corynebacterium sp. HMSC070E08]|uniref:hypothetical protein n=1 Tax=Corynebacterium sp. HMSC070E08 TaxID=1715006 RepID=UPI0008A4F769|nr:hypothetical protein [Corynebacterium sp. HMSC070E08]OFN80066.1 hypothetical protein HMPREF2526_06150 [Corynebacterium sp. HMSC070E08]